ncbi:hypothetical protein PBI_CORAL_1 [Arthrobacter phage Coral]|uniref:Uncharacterized protein n=2 Tax=Coralvirus coral TaxID=2734227 RepID=A0A3G2KIF5_9CAUD|nr:hypothetical protein HOU54_gp01 [Arthrobacter phage Coral]AYN57477.1 hypothetical protein PBI_CORAL_1 [Arthrobacter phage Coral]AYN58758.1 hypothetical protein PBI_POLKA_1 [Arthrobacter phage Polka]
MHDEHKGRAVAAAREGQRVAVVAATLPAAQEICGRLADLVEGEPAVTVRRLNGAHSIDFAGGGSIVFRSFRSSHRGMSFDRVFVPIGTSADLVRELLPSLSVSGGPLVGY